MKGEVLVETFSKYCSKRDGKTTNRDAVGARIEVVLAGNSRRLVKSKSAGGSSQEVHFGLGTADGESKIEKVVIHWPTNQGKREEVLTGP